MLGLIRALEQGDLTAELAYNLYAYRIRKYIGAYAAVLNGSDALVRSQAWQHLDFLGIALDED